MNADPINAKKQSKNQQCKDEKRNSKEQYFEMKCLEETKP